MSAAQAVPAKQLPPNSSLEQLKNQARDLQKEHRSGDRQVCDRIRASLRRLSKASVAEVRDARFTLRDAQSVIAREYGFSSWAKLRAHVEAASASTGAMSREEALAVIAERYEEVARVVRSMQREPERVAVLLVALGQDRTAYVIRYLSDGEMEAATQAIANLKAVTREVEDDALAHLAQRLQSGDLDRQTSPETSYGEFVAGALETALGYSRARGILKRHGITAAPKGKKRQLSKKHQAMKRAVKKQLQSTPMLSLDLESTRRTLVKLGELARAGGILTLEDMIPSPPDDPTRVEELFRIGMMLMVDGTRPEELREMLDNQKATIVHNLETRCKMLIEGLVGIRAGRNFRVIDQKLRFMYDHPVE